MKSYFVYIVAEEVDMCNTLRLCAAACGAGEVGIDVFDTLADLVDRFKGVDSVDICPLCAKRLSRDAAGDESVLEIVECVGCQATFYVTELGLLSVKKEENDED